MGHVHTKIQSFLFFSLFLFAMERSTLNSEPTNLCRYYCWQAGALWICNYRQTDPVTIWTSQIHFRETHSSSMELETEELCARFTGGWKNWKHLVQYYRDLVHFSRRGNLRIQIVSPMFLTFTFPPFWNGKGRRKEKGTGTMQRHSPCQSHAGLFFFRAQLFARGRANVLQNSPSAGCRLAASFDWIFQNCNKMLCSF
jgi:hypothetical protein